MRKVTFKQLVLAFGFLLLPTTMCRANGTLMADGFGPFSRICNSGAVSISIFNAKKTILPCFSEKMLFFAAEKDLVAMRTTAIERGLQIPILGTSELQIRWNGYSARL